MTKFEIALNKFAENPNVARKDFIARLVVEAEMTVAGASTYFATVKKKYGNVPAAPINKADELEVIKEGKNAKGDHLRIVKIDNVYSLQLNYNKNQWMIIEGSDTESEAIEVYKMFGGL